MNNYETVIRNIAASIQGTLIIARLIIHWISISKSKSESILQWGNDLGKIHQINQSEWRSLYYLMISFITTRFIFLYLFYAHNFCLFLSLNGLWYDKIILKLYIYIFICTYRVNHLNILTNIGIRKKYIRPNLHNEAHNLMKIIWKLTVFKWNDIFFYNRMF